jgi:hypothetical protein
VFLLAAMGIVLTAALKYVERRVAPWSHGRR